MTTPLFASIKNQSPAMVTFLRPGIGPRDLELDQKIHSSFWSLVPPQVWRNNLRMMLVDLDQTFKSFMWDFDDLPPSNL